MVVKGIFVSRSVRWKYDWCREMGICSTPVKNKKVAHEPPRRVGHLCSYHVMGRPTVYL